MRGPVVVSALRVTALLAATALLAGCGGSTEVSAAASSSVAVASSTAPSSGASASGAPTVAQWCASYAALTSVLAQNSPDAGSPDTALAALERFDQLWGVADNLGVVAPDEVAANQRAVASYRRVLSLLAAGKTRTSPEVTSATAALTSQTNADRTLLRDSASRVLSLCGVPSPTASP